MRRIMPPVWLLGSGVLMTTAHYLLPIRRVVPSPLNLGGIVFLFAGLAIFAWSVLRIRRAKTTIIPFRESTSLVTNGPFRVSRNPIYLAMVLALFGTAVLFGSLSPLLVVPMFALLIDRVFIVGEERMLRTTFSGDYDMYCRRVRRWI